MTPARPGPDWRNITVTLIDPVAIGPTREYEDQEDAKTAGHPLASLKGRLQKFSLHRGELWQYLIVKRWSPNVLCTRNSLDGGYGVYRVHSDRPGASSSQQPLNDRGLPRSVNRISPGHHVHSSGETATKTCLRCAFHCTNVPGLGEIPRRARLTSEAKALIPTGTLSSG